MRTIVDETGKPLDGVHVAVEYWGEGPYFYGSHRNCFRLEVAVTQADGRFDVPFFSGNFNPVYTRSQNIRYFRAGYETVLREDDAAELVRMRPFSGDTKQRFDTWTGDYRIYNPRVSCPDATKKFHSLLLAIHAEAKEIAKTTDERKAVIGLEYEIELPELGEKAASNAMQEKLLRLMPKTELLKVWPPSSLLDDICRDYEKHKARAGKAFKPEQFMRPAQC